ncbi:MAG: hypothetical protein AB7O66_20540 [Limisphaerales bacterium]
MLLAAALLWLGDFASPRVTATARDTSPTFRLDDEDVEEEDDEDEETMGFLDPELSVSGALREWMENAATLDDGFRDDPFLDFVPLAKAPEAARGSPSESESARTPPRLQAISLGASQPLAVLGGSVVGVGDSVGAWRVAGIEMDTVWVEGPGGKLGLQISREPRPSPARSTDGGVKDTAITQVGRERRLPDSSEPPAP